MAFLKNIWKTSSKHKKLSEEWVLAKTNQNEIEMSETNEDAGENDDVTFTIKYLGSTLVERASSEADTAEAIKTILRVAKAGGKKLPRVQVVVSLKGIKITDEQSGKENEISIYRISYCSADATNSRVFAFIAANNNETMECHAFLCPKRKITQAVTLSVARAFSMAYEAWRLTPSTAGNKDKLPEKCDTRTPLNQLIDLEDFKLNHPANISVARPRGLHNDWVSFDDDSEAQRLLNSPQIDLICS